MGDDADQLPRRIAGQAGVAVERDAVPHARQHGHVADVQDEAGVGRAPQQTVELLDLPALALPPHPQPFALVPLPRAMEEEEARRRVRGVLHVERLDAASRGREDLAVAGQRFRRCVAEIAEDGEVDVADRGSRAPAPRGARSDPATPSTLSRMVGRSPSCTRRQAHDRDRAAAAAAAESGS